ncbi:MAG: FecR domain-containing protein [Chitinophagaceae bacterium]|nr:FecR domain-containing protein [Chitinophagaceae bacterium]
METHQLELLIKKYNAGECTPEEKQWLEQWYLSFEWSDAEALPDAVMNELKAAAWNRLRQYRNEQPAIPMLPVSVPVKPSVKRWWYYIAAAAVVSVAFIGFRFLYAPGEKAARTPANTIAEAQTPKDILPGTSKASLVLGDGSVIALDAVAVSQIEEGDGTTINKQHGKIIYDNTSGNSTKVVYNTLNIPRGAEYELVLPDGSKVWLNAASYLRFPTRFLEKERTVYLSGEAYFEIAKNAAQPFKVITRGNMEVEVTGTHFNVMAYDDEEFIKTTLTEGKVNIRNGKSITPLTPMQQAALEKSSGQVDVKKVDIDKEIAWKNGMIGFNDDKLPYIMRQLSRWYDVDVRFEGSIPQGGYNGSIPRKATLSEVMEILKIAGVQYRLDNRTVVITGG